MTEQIDYKAKCAEYEKRMGIGQYDPAKEGYLVLVSLLNQQNEYLKDFKLKSKITSDDTATKEEYKNAKALWEYLPKMIESVSNLKIALKMEGEEKKINIKPISATSSTDDE
jgi:hypothetical protein